MDVNRAQSCCLLLNFSLFWRSRCRSYRSEDSFSNGDGNEIVKKSNGLNRQNNNCKCITLFCTFICCHCTTMTWIYLISRFMEDVNRRRRIVLSLSKLKCSLQEINSRVIRLHFQRNGINATKFEKREFILLTRFSLPWQLSLLTPPSFVRFLLT